MRYNDRSQRGNEVSSCRGPGAGCRRCRWVVSRCGGCRWDAFLDWLADSGLLTAKMQSRTPSAAAGTTSLDGLRGGDVGEAIARSSISAASLFTNSLLPGSST